MRKSAIILTFIVSSFLDLVWASEPILGPVKAPTTTTLVNKKAWIENMQNSLPSILCKSDQHFMKCFDTTAKECVDLNKLFVQTCLNHITSTLPSELSTDEATHWGSVIGKCTFDIYEKFMQSKKLSKPECNQSVKNEP